MIPPKAFENGFKRVRFDENEIIYKNKSQRIILKKSILRDYRGNVPYVCLKQSVIRDKEYETTDEMMFHSFTEAVEQCWKENPERYMDALEQAESQRRYEMGLQK